MNLTCDTCPFAKRVEEEYGSYHEKSIGRPRICRIALILYGINSCHIDGDGYVDDRNEKGILPNCPRKMYSEKGCYNIVRVDDINKIKNKIDSNNSKIQKLNNNNSSLIDELMVLLEEEYI